MGVPQAAPIPSMPLAPPQLQLPQWEPIPVYRDDIPALNPQPEQQQESTEEEKKPDKQGQKPEPQKPEPGIPPEILDLVDGMRTPTPPLPPFVPYEPEVESQVETIELPGGFEMPVPKQEIMITAVSTAGAAAIVSVGATMVAGDLFKRIVSISKPVIKAVLKKLAKLRKTAPPQTWARQRRGSHLHISGRSRWKDGS
jgi:hypothetical protein